MATPPFEVVPEEEPAASDNALLEAARFADRNLKRDDAVRTHIHRGGLVVYWTFVSVGVGLFLIWSWHLGAPERWRFLTVEQRNDLQMVLLSAVGSSFVTEASRRWLHPRKN
jgi:hypothetical protein